MVQEALNGHEAEHTLTCADKHHMMLLAISSLYLVDNDACEFPSPSHQQRLFSYWQDSLVHEGPEFDELKGGVWEVQCLIYACFTSLIVNTLVEGTEEKDDKQSASRREEQTCCQKLCLKRLALLQFSSLFYDWYTHMPKQCLDSQLQAEGRGRLHYT